MYESRVFYNIHRYVGQFNDNKAEGIGIKSYYEEKKFIVVDIKMINEMV